MALIRRRFDSDFQRIISVKPIGPTLEVRFANGDVVKVETKLLLREEGLNWNRVTVGDHGVCLIVPRGADEVDIPWDAVRRASNPEFRAAMEEADDQQALSLGMRLRHLREIKQITQQALAQRVGTDQ